MRTLSSQAVQNSAASRGQSFLSVGIYLNEAVLRTELDAGRIGLLPVLLHGPTIEKLGAYIERAKGIPDQVGTGIRGVVVCSRCCCYEEGSVVYCGVRINRTGAKGLPPIVLICCLNSNSRSGLQARRRVWFCINPQSRGVLEIPGDPMSGRNCKDRIVLVECLQAGGEIHAPSENGIRFGGRSCWNKRRDRAKYCRDLEVSSFEFLAQTDRSVGARSIGLRGKLRSLEGYVRTRLLDGNIERRARTQRKAITQLGVANTDHAIWPLEVKSVRKSVRIHEV